MLTALLLLLLSQRAEDRAVLIYPKERLWFRRVFYNAHQRQLRAKLEKRYAVVVHDQVATAEELLNTDVRGARLLVLSGHGDPYAMFFGADGKRTIDSRHRARLRAFFDTLHPRATIVLQSCDTGRGFAWTVKEAAGPHRRVIAAKGWVPSDGVRITSVEPLDVRFTCRDERGRMWDCTIRI
jgi:hypothetical protein